MIDRLDPTDSETARAIGALSPIEPAWEWLGELRDGELVAVMAIEGRGRECTLHRLVVAEPHRRGGIGRRMIEAISHHHVVNAAVATDEAALRFFDAVGFHRIGTVDGVVRLEHWNTHLATSFDADVDNYEAARPGYPAELFALLADHCGVGLGTRMLEVGPGPGLATVPLLDLGAHIVAVEPGANMAARLRRRTAGRSIEIIESTFEAAHLTGPFDVVVAATSFHWTDVKVSIRKAASLLPPGAWLALWWNVHRTPHGHDDPLDKLLTPIAERFQTAERMASISYGFDVDARRAEITAGGWFEAPDYVPIPYSFTHSAASLRALFASFSDWSTLPEPDRTQALDDVAAIVDDHFGGTITRVYTTSVYLARRS